MENESERLVARATAVGYGSMEHLAAGSRVTFMVMPAGTHTCNFGKPGTKGPAQRTVVVDEDTMRAFQEQLTAINAARGGKQRAYFDFDHKEEGPAAGWPERFFWSNGKDGQGAGVYCVAELSQAGAEAIKGKNYRGFSPAFYATKTQPARVVCNPEGELNMGSLVNEPAFREMEPLWARDRGGSTGGNGGNGETGRISAAGGAGAVTEQPSQNERHQKTMEKTAEEKAVAAAQQAATENAEALQAKDNKIIALTGRLEAAEKRETERRTRIAKEAIEGAVKEGRLAPQDEKLQARYRGLIEADEENVVLLAALPKNPALDQGRIAQGAAAGTERIAASEGPKRVLQAMEKLTARQKAIRGFDAASMAQRGELAREISRLYAADVSKKAEVLNMPLAELLTAAADSDTVGTLSGTLVVQRTLEFFRINYPLFKAIYLDFSDQPALLNQVINTRIVSKPSVQTYDNTLDTDGRPKGWGTASAATTTDANVSIDEHVGVPVVFGANTLASTIRRLFDEQAPAMSYALASYFVAKLYAKITAANFNGYAAVSGSKVPVAYATYVKGAGDFARSAVVDLNAIFNPNEVPLHDRALLLNSAYASAVAKDPSLVTFWAAQRSPELISEGELPKMSKFVPIECPDFPSSNNRVGFAMQKNALIAVSRVPTDYSQALPGANYGSVTMISDPETGLSVMLVQYVNHRGGYAEMRMETMIGAGVGDKRGGLVLTSQ